MSYAPKLIKRAEKITGFSAKDYQFQIEEDGFYDRLITDGITIFAPDGKVFLIEGLPKSVRKMGNQVAKIFGIEQSILAPLEYGGKIRDILYVTGSDLEESDAIAITAFGNQTAIALENSLLFHHANTAQERFRALADSAMVAILMIEGECKISYWNASAERIFGYSSEEVMGVDLHKVILWDSCHQEYFEGLAIFMKSGEVPEVHGTLEIEAVKKDGTEFPIEISISTFQVNGEWNAVGIIREISN